MGGECSIGGTAEIVIGLDVFLDGLTAVGRVVLVWMLQCGAQRAGY